MGVEVYIRLPCVQEREGHPSRGKKAPGLFEEGHPKREQGAFYLQLDIENYFMSIDKDILCGIIIKHNMLWLVIK